MDHETLEITDDRIMHLSRAVLTQQTIELLTNAQDANWPVYGASFPTGALMVATEFAIRRFAPSDLRRVIDFALSKGCSYVVFYSSRNRSDPVAHPRYSRGVLPGRRQIR
jgi:hypothetical protein